MTYNFENITTLIFNNNNYKFDSQLDSNIFYLGNGSFLLTGIKKTYPILINFENNKNIEFLGNNIYLDENNNPVTYKNEQNNIFNFYYGTVELKVNDNFNKITGYKIYDESTKSIISRETEFKYLEDNLNGSSTDNYLKYYENNKLQQYFFTNSGNDGKNIKITGYDRILNQNKSIYPFTKSYLDYDNLEYLNIRSNFVPNYLPIYNTSIIKGLWKNNFNAIANTNSENYGIDEHNYGLIKNNNEVLGNPIRIPINPELASKKYIPETLYDTENTNRTLENFWYKSDRNWNEIMVTRNQQDILVDENEVLTPLGPIGIMVNGIPCYNHVETYQTYINQGVNNLSKISNSNIDRLHINEEKIESNINQVPIQNYDNYGGTVDLNHIYHYNKYPVGLEALIKFGTYNSEYVNESPNLYTSINDGTKKFISKGVYYFNISDISISDYDFNLKKITSDNSIIELSSIGQTRSKYLLLNVLSLPENTIYNLEISKNNVIITTIQLYLNTESNNDYDADSLYYFKLDNNDLKIYEAKELSTNDSDVNKFKYSGYLKNINDSTNDIITTTNDIYKYLNSMLILGNNPTQLSNAKNYHSPILGWAFDGYPIYGPLGYNIDGDNYTIKLLKSSYNQTTKKYEPNLGDLDICNGIFCPTPEFPEGIYHYVCTIHVSNSEVNFIDDSLYAYPYIIGAYRGIPELSNFNLLYKETTPPNEIIAQTDEYEINVRTLRASQDIYNGIQEDKNKIYQDDNYIYINQSSKPFILDLTNTTEDNEYFGNSSHIVSDNVNNLLSNLNNDTPKKTYGSLSILNLKDVNDVTLGHGVVFYTDSKKLYIKNSDGKKNILGIVVSIDSIKKICYVCTKGICEIYNENLNNTDTNDLLICNESGKIINIDETFNSQSTDMFYIIGTYISNNNNNHLIDVNPHIITK